MVLDMIVPFVDNHFLNAVDNCPSFKVVVSSSSDTEVPDWISLGKCLLNIIQKANRRIDNLRVDITFVDHTMSGSQNPFIRND